MIVLTDSRLGTTGILGGMQLGVLPAAGAASIRLTQQPLELTQFPIADVWETQAVLEWPGTNPPASNVNETQAALEHIGFPPNEVWETQACLEVLFPAVIRRNYAYMGTLART